jgi:NAD(P) transhydrogenase subunit beta
MNVVMNVTTVNALGNFAVPIVYIASTVFFVLGLKLMCRVRRARRGVTLLGLGFVLALAGLVLEAAHLDPKLVLAGVAAGLVLGLIVGLTGKVELGAGFAPLLAAAGGVAAVLVAVSAFLSDEAWPLGGALALEGGPRGAALGLAIASGLAALVLGVLAAQGPAARGSGQPSVVALAASASGLASAMVGFALGNPIVVTVGGLVATAGWTLAAIVASALGREPLDVAFGSGGKAGESSARDEYRNVKACGPEETAMVLENARKVVLVPGYGMAVAQAQHALAEIAKMLSLRGVKVVYAIHPAAGLIPGHMNILLDEAKVPAAQILEWEAANAELADADVALVVGANDIVNPATLNDATSAVFGMPLIDVARARAVFVIKRSLRPGAAGAKNALFDLPQTNMVLGDAKKVLQAIGVELKAQTPAAAAA